MAVGMFLEKFGSENVIETTTNFLYEFDDLYQGALLITSPPGGKINPV